MTTLAPTLSTRYFPRAAGWLRDLVLILIGSLFVALLARVEILLPGMPVPITGQTFGVLLVGAALGSKRGAASMTLYLAEGALGLPFFAGGGAFLDSLLAFLGERSAFLDPTATSFIRCAFSEHAGQPCRTAVGGAKPAVRSHQSFQFA